MLPGKIIAGVPDPAFRLYQDLIPEIRLQAEGLRKDFFTYSVTVYIRMVKEIDPLFQSGTNQDLCFFYRQNMHPETSQCDI